MPSCCIIPNVSQCALLDDLAVRKAGERHPALEAFSAEPVRIETRQSPYGHEVTFSRRFRRSARVSSSAAALVLAVHPLLGSARTACNISNRLLRVLSLKGLLSCALQQVASPSLPLPACDP